MNCRHCGAELSLPFLDLGTAPPSNAYLTEEQLQAPETWYPLRLLVCESCWLVQTEDYAGREALFDNHYAYFSSTSTSWLKHAESYVEVMVERFHLDDSSTVVEVAANDGYLLQYIKKRDIPSYGVEPTGSTAAAARDKGIEIVEDFFGTQLARDLTSQGRSADLMVANNVLAHVPDINDFVAGFATLLKPNGVATFEFPHLLRMVEGVQFDTAYHEHFSYLSLTAVVEVFHNSGLLVFDVEELPTHGGSLRVFAQRMKDGAHPIAPTVERLLEKERNAGMRSCEFYRSFQKKAERVKNDLLTFLLKAKEQGKTVVGYGAAAKGNTLLNFAGVKEDLIPFVCDAAPSKQGKFLPGSRIPVKTPEAIESSEIDGVIVLPWNIVKEVIAQFAARRRPGVKFYIAVPKLREY